jgi:tRNA U34 5-methylaminomethyl-2-thiouridine-forming methyltransferase MnmC
MDVAAQLLQLESKHRSASASAAAAKAHYLSLHGKPGSATSLARAIAKWEDYESRKRIIAARIAVIEELLPNDRHLEIGSRIGVPSIAQHPST